MTADPCTVKQFKECSITGKKYESGSSFQYHIFAAHPEQPQEELALYLLLEHDFDKMTALLQGFMEEGLIPWGMVIFVYPGKLFPSLPEGTPRNMRPEEFDEYGDEFPNFLVEELIPHACQITGEKFSSSPDMHFICGSSSGGLTAWNCVWFRNDYFRRTFLSSPTFSAIRGGEEAMVLARKTETKPIKLYITTGTEEPDYFFGSSLIAAQNAAAALEFAGYDLRFEQFNGEGHGCRREDPTLWRRMMVFLWANWKTTPVMPLGNQIKIRKLVADGSCWEEFKGSFPEKTVPAVNGGVYTFENDKIYIEKDGLKKAVAENFGHITALAVSTDKWRLYIADETRRFIFAMSIMPDGTLEHLSKLAPLHLAHDLKTPGAADIAVLADDRILAATELGIQGVMSFGITDLILPLPGDLPADKVAVCGSRLYVLSGEKIFCRELKISGSDDSLTPPENLRYNDGFSYSRSHLFFS